MSVKQFREGMYNQANKSSQSVYRKSKQAPKVTKTKADFAYISPFGYKILKEIGRGGYGVVYKAVKINNDDQLCAIKINFNTVSRQLIYAEMAFLMLVKDHSRLPNLLNLFVYHDITHIVIEYFKFKPFITFFHTMPLDEVRHYIYELLIGLKQLKGLGIYHRDIKPGNFLYNQDTRRGLIIDFGLAQIDPKYLEQMERRLTQMRKQKDAQIQQFEKKVKIYRKLSECLKIIGRNKIGTQTYMPLQSILHHRQQSYESDIWPVGVTLLQFLARKYNIFNSVKLNYKPHGIKSNYYINYLLQLAAFYGDDVVKQCKKLNYSLKLPADIEHFTFKQIQQMQGYDDITEDLLTKMLCLDHKKRITVEQALQHPFFDSIRHQH